MVERLTVADPVGSGSEKTVEEAATRPKVASFLVDAGYKEQNLAGDVIGRRDVCEGRHPRAPDTDRFQSASR